MFCLRLLAVIPTSQLYLVVVNLQQNGKRSSTCGMPLVVVRYTLKWWHQSGFALKKLSSKLWSVIVFKGIRRESRYMWGEWLLLSVGVPVCETAMKVEWYSRLTRPSLWECVIWAWQWCNGIFLMNYRDLVCCESERAKEIRGTVLTNQVTEFVTTEL